MDNELYDLVYSGEIMPNAELSQVKRNLQQLFRLDADRVELLFSGRSITLKKNLTLDAAGKYRTAMKKAGARVDLVPVQVDKQELTPATPHTEKPAVPEKAAPGTATTWTSALGAQPAGAVPAARPTIDAPAFEVAEPGAALLNESEKPASQPVQVDISHLDVKENVGNLVSADEIVHSPPVEVGSLGAELLPPGSDLLKPEERRQTSPLDIDLSGYDLAPPGTTLGPEKEDPPAPPSVDHIQLLE